MKDDLLQHLLANDVDLPTSLTTSESESQDDESKRFSSDAVVFIFFFGLIGSVTFFYKIFWLFY